MKLVVELHPGVDVEAFPKYRKNFTTAYEVIARVGNDARKRGVDSSVGEMIDYKGPQHGYIVKKETDEHGENIIIGTWSAE